MHNAFTPVQAAPWPDQQPVDQGAFGSLPPLPPGLPSFDPGFSPVPPGQPGFPPPGSFDSQPPLPPGLPPMDPGFSPVPPGMPGSGGSPVSPTTPQVTPVATGTPGVDALTDLPGDTELYCGPNQDFLLFQDGSGLDLVFDFDPSDNGDTIAIEQNINGSDLWSVDQLAITDTEYGAVVDLGGGNGFLLAGISSAQLDATDFAIHQPQMDTGGYLLV